MAYRAYRQAISIGRVVAIVSTLRDTIIDDIISNEGLNKQRQSLSELAIPGRHRNHYLWLLTQPYSAITKNLRRQAKPIFVWYPKVRADLKKIHDENNVLTDGE